MQMLSRSSYCSLQYRALCRTVSCVLHIGQNRPVEGTDVWRNLNMPKLDLSSKQLLELPILSDLVVPIRVLDKENKNNFVPDFSR